MQAISNPSWSGGDALAPGERLPVVVGELIGAKYKVDQILGMGGMAVVAAATHVELGQRVALKVLRQPRVTPESIERFLREARAAVSLTSHHVAKVIDVGTLTSGLPFMVMELLDGKDFASILERDGALKPYLAIDYMVQACDAIAEAHRLGIIHRDLKPENLFLTHKHDGTPLVKVLDFGISKITTPIQITASMNQHLAGPTAASRRSVTHESTLMGSPMYMSPEQIRSAKDVDSRTDIWALGAILFELITGHRPFEADNVADIFVKVLDKPTPSVDVHLPNTPQGLKDIIERCLEKDRTKRYATVGAFARALSDVDLGGGERGRTPPPPASVSAVAAWNRSINLGVDSVIAGGAAVSSSLASNREDAFPVHETTHSETFVLPGRRPLRFVRVIGALVLLGVVGGGGFMAYRHRDRFLTTKSSSTTAAAAATNGATATATTTATNEAPATSPSSTSTVVEAMTTTPAPATSSKQKRPKSKAKSFNPAEPAAADPVEPVAPPPAAAAPETSAKHQRTEW